jgi:hypothetical protein
VRSLENESLNMKYINTKSLCVFIASIVSGGCLQTLVGTPDATMKLLVGKPVADLITQYGLPNEKQLNADGSEVWKYFIDKRRMVASNQQPFINPPDQTPPRPVGIHKNLDDLARDEQRFQQEKMAKEMAYRQWLAQVNSPDSLRVVGYIAVRGFIVKENTVINYFWEGL